MKAAVYIRVSTPGQAINGESLDMQKDRLLEYVKNQKWEPFKTYEDGGFSEESLHFLLKASFDELRCFSFRVIFNLFNERKI